MPPGGKHAPGPKWYQAPAVLRSLRRDPLKFHRKMHQRHGDVVRLSFGFSSAYLLRRPEHAKHVLQDNHTNYDKQNFDYRILKTIVGEGLLTSNGDHWRRQRALIQPAFQRERITALIPLIVERSEALLARWKTQPETARDVSRDMSRLTLEIVTEALFGVDAGESAAEIGEAFLILSRNVMDQYGSLPAMLTFLPTPGNLRAKRARNRLHAIVDTLIAERRRRPPGDDLLSAMLAARDGESGQPMSEKQLRDEVTTLLLAGHDTTANALGWTFYLLSQHREIADRLEAELDQILAGKAVEAEAIPALNYGRAVLQESMRLYPPAWIISRATIEADEIGGYTVEKRALVAVCTYDMQRLPDIWPEPESFDPERFVNSHGGPVPFAYYPFGAGPRMCIGAGLATTEAIVILATIMQKCRLQLVPGQTVEPEALITLRPRNGLKMTVDWR